MIPKWTREGLLPPGLHDGTLAVVRRRFGSQNALRIRLMKGLMTVLRRAAKAGARRLYLDGSFVTDKREPGDWDGVLVVPAGFPVGGRDGTFLADRKRIKVECGGDLFVVMEDDADIVTYYVQEVFGRDREGRTKGLVLIRLQAGEADDGADQE